MFQGSLPLRSFVKRKTCQIYDLIDYATLHPSSTLRKLAHQSTIEFIMENCREAVACRDPQSLMNISLDASMQEGCFMEFGVYKGASIRYIAKRRPNITIHGFDSFTGLPEAWVHHNKNAFSLGGKLPQVPQNVILHKGYFDETLPHWVSQNQDKVAFLHVDCDLYSSTKTVFNLLKERFQPGTVIMFDDYFNFPYWEKDGHQAFTELLGETSIKFKYIGYAYKELTILITDV